MEIKGAETSENKVSRKERMRKRGKERISPNECDREFLL